MQDEDSFRRVYSFGPMTRMVLGFQDAEAIAEYAAEEFVRLAKDAIWTRGVFHVALAGGSTPKRTYELLATLKYAKRVEWTSVQFYFGDERAVEADHDDSNFNMAQNALFETLPLHHSQLHRMAGERSDLDGSALEYESTMERFFNLKRGQGLPRFDLVYLGMGKDGHTASLFPHTAGLEAEDRWVVANEVPQLNTSRITITPNLINAARAVVVLVSGTDKAEALERVLEGPFEPQEYPSQLIDPSDGEHVWLVDEAAASHLKKQPTSPDLRSLAS